VSELGDIRLARYFRVFIEDQIAQRKFNDATEVIEEALRLLESGLRRALQEGLDSGDAGPLDMNEIKRLGRERAAAFTADA
jgi:antitoxin ParD1/3/4